MTSKAGSRVVAEQESTQRSAADLYVAEQFVLRALRTRLEGPSGQSRLEQGFRLARDDANGGALAAFEPWFAVLAANCRRDLYLHRALCPCLSGDELAMLELAATRRACIASRRPWCIRRRSGSSSEPAGRLPTPCVVWD